MVVKCKGHSVSAWLAHRMPLSKTHRLLSALECALWASTVEHLPSLCVSWGADPVLRAALVDAER